MHTQAPFNILVTCAGRKVPLVESLRRAMRQQGLDGVIIGVDGSPFSAVLQVCDYSYVVPRADDPAYLSTLLQLCRQHQVSLLLPLIDLDLLILAEHRELFADAGVLALVSSLPVVRTCRDKRATLRFFSEHDIPTVRTLTTDELATNKLPYPLFVKPAHGSGSVNSFKVSNPQELAFFLRYVPDPVVQVFATGQEYTVDALVDLQGRVINVVPRRRLEVRAGEISKGMTVKNWRIIDATVHLLETLGGIGPLTVQCFVDDDQVYFTEVNPRVGGGLPLTIAAGADYPAQIIKMAQGQTVEPCIGAFADDYYMFRYEEAIYVPGATVRDVQQTRVV